jgi:hypothetical protein
MSADGRVVKGPMVLTISKCWDEGVKDDSVVDGFREDGELLLASNCSDDGAIDDSEDNGPNEVGDSLRDIVGVLDSTMLAVGALDGFLSVGLRVNGDTPLGLHVLISTAVDGSNVDANPLGEFVGTTV